MSRSDAQVLFEKDWTASGIRNPVTDSGRLVSIVAFGADRSGLVPSDEAMKEALSSNAGASVIIYFPEGRYLFNKTIHISRSGCILRGDGSQKTKLIFDLGGKGQNCIEVGGSLSAKDSSSMVVREWRNSGYAGLSNARSFAMGDWVRLRFNDSAYLFSNWAYGSLGQIMQIVDTDGDRAYLSAGPRWYYESGKDITLQRINPASQCGIECLGIERKDATSTQTSLMDFSYATDSWVRGVESAYGQFAHVSVSYCAHLEIKGNYFHHAFGYGGGGMGYGVVLQFASSQCRVENNIFEHLRHAVLFQAGANGNVVSYNYMTDPFWTGEITPANSAGDIVLHGNFPFANLIEGNINQNTVIDHSHGANGTFNTFFRNRSELYGFVVTATEAADSLQIIMNEITHPSLGFYFIQGKGHVQVANMVKNVITPAGTLPWVKPSLYLADYRPECYGTADSWPVIGDPTPFNSKKNAAALRYNGQLLTLCRCEDDLLQTSSPLEKRIVEILPNPVTNLFQIISDEKPLWFEVKDLQGREVLSRNGAEADVPMLGPGLYLVRIFFATGIAVLKLQKY